MLCGELKLHMFYLYNTLDLYLFHCDTFPPNIRESYFLEDYQEEKHRKISRADLESKRENERERKETFLCKIYSNFIIFLKVKSVELCRCHLQKS